MRDGYSDASKRVMGPMPLRPSIKAVQLASVPTPSGDTSPTPVTATRRRSLDLKIGIRCGGWRCRGGGAVLVSDVVLDVVDRFFHVADLLGLLVRDLDPELLFEGHHQLDDVQGVRSQIVGEAGFQRDLFL